MPRKFNLSNLNKRSTQEIDAIMKRVENPPKGTNYHFKRWMHSMSAVQLHGVWERYAEDRLVASLNHDAKHFVSENNIKGVAHVSVGLAQYVIRGGNRYFDFRSMGELIGKGDDCVGKNHNPFRNIVPDCRQYLDALAAIRNCVVHISDAAFDNYKRKLKAVYNIQSAPQPDEFLNAVDNRANCPARYKTRLKGLSIIVHDAIKAT